MQSFHEMFKTPNIWKNTHTRYYRTLLLAICSAKIFNAVEPREKRWKAVDIHISVKSVLLTDFLFNLRNFECIRFNLRGETKICNKSSMTMRQACRHGEI